MPQTSHRINEVRTIWLHQNVSTHNKLGAALALQSRRLPANSEAFSVCRRLHPANLRHLQRPPPFFPSSTPRCGFRPSLAEGKVLSSGRLRGPEWITKLRKINGFKSRKEMAFGCRGIPFPAHAWKRQDSSFPSELCTRLSKSCLISHCYSTSQYHARRLAGPWYALFSKRWTGTSADVDRS